MFVSFDIQFGSNKQHAFIVAKHNLFIVKIQLDALKQQNYASISIFCPTMVERDAKSIESS